MQDGINSNARYKFNSKYNNYTYMYYTNSQVKSSLESWYQTNIGSKADLAKTVASGNYYCEQAKVKYTSSYTASSANMIVYDNYMPDFKCASDGNGKGVVNASIGLLSYDESVYAGMYFGEKNESSYLYSNYPYWLISPGGLSFDNYANAWSIDIKYGSLIPHAVSDSYILKPIINFKSDINILSGDGTKSNPFVVE